MTQFENKTSVINLNFEEDLQVASRPAPSPPSPTAK